MSKEIKALDICEVADCEKKATYKRRDVIDPGAVELNVQPLFSDWYDACEEHK